MQLYQKKYMDKCVLEIPTVSYCHHEPFIFIIHITYEFLTILMHLLDTKIPSKKLLN